MLGRFFRRSPRDNGFEEAFEAWLADAIRGTLPDGIVAFCFNLYEPAQEAGVKFGVELIGAGTFDESDDWPCDEVWEPAVRGVSIPVAYSGDQWQDCLTKMKDLVSRHLKDGTDVTRRLKSVQGVGVGFVDGDLEVLWQAGT